ncbi:MAG TPA: tetratricopeptide repeat protein [Armatimonadota bacterium]|nr:tetratricopeptide repeat protein [Armatimonadota bacterium]
MRLTVCFAVLAILVFSVVVQTSSQASSLAEARQLIEGNDCSQAISMLEQIAASDSASAPEALRLMGGCCKKLLQWSKAIQSFERLLTDYPDSVAPNREVKLWIMDCHLANNQPAEALALQKELLTEYPQDSWKFHYILGRRHVWMQNYPQAIPELENAVTLGVNSQSDPSFLDANRRLLHSYVEGKQWTKAQALAQTLLGSHPELAYEWRYEIGRCWQGTGDHAKAVESLEMAVQLAPKDAGDLKPIRKALLDSYDASNRVEKAISLAENMLRDYPNEPTWAWELGSHYVDNKQYDKAVPLFRKVLESSGRRWEIRSSQQYLARCLYKLDKGNEALAGLDDYYKNKPELWDEYLLAKAVAAFYGSEDDGSCVQILEGLVAQVSAGHKSDLIPTARELMYKALLRQGEWDKLGPILEQMASQSNDPNRLCEAGESYYKAGMYAEAIQVYHQALQETKLPDNMRAVSMYGLALCYWETGLKDDAKQLMEEVSKKYPNTHGGSKAGELLGDWSQVK